MASALNFKKWYQSQALAYETTNQNTQGVATYMPNAVMIGLMCAAAAVLPNLGSMVRLLGAAGSFTTLPILMVGAFLAYKLMSPGTMSGAKSGNNTFDRLNGLIDFHLSQGRLDEADALSLHLLDMVE